MRDAGGRSRGFAFLTFEEPAAVNAVMVREHFLDGKVVRTVPSELGLTMFLFTQTARTHLFVTLLSTYTCLPCWLLHR